MCWRNICSISLPAAAFFHLSLLPAIFPFTFPFDIFPPPWFSCPPTRPPPPSRRRERYWTFRLRWAGLFLFHTIHSIEHDLWLQARQYIFDIASRHSGHGPASLLYSLPVSLLPACSLSALVKYERSSSE